MKLACCERAPQVLHWIEAAEGVNGTGEDNPAGWYIMGQVEEEFLNLHGPVVCCPFCVTPVPVPKVSVEVTE